MLTVLEQDVETAGAVMSDESFAVSLESTVEEVLYKVKQDGNKAEIVYYIYVVDDKNVLKGIISLKKLIIYNSQDIIKDIMAQQIVSIPTDMAQEDAGKVI